MKRATFIQIATGGYGDGSDGGIRDHTLYALDASGRVWVWWEKDQAWHARDDEQITRKR